MIAAMPTVTDQTVLRLDSAMMNRVALWWVSTGRTPQVRLTMTTACCTHQVHNGTRDLVYVRSIVLELQCTYSTYIPSEGGTTVEKSLCHIMSCQPLIIPINSRFRTRRLQGREPRKPQRIRSTWQSCLWHVLLSSMMVRGTVLV